MATALHAVDFGFRPIRPEEVGEEGDERMDVGAQTRDPRVSVYPEAAMETADEEDLCFADEETLPDATGFDYDDFSLEGYRFHPHIPAVVAV